jgi:UDP-hydrolysing UDP-N-acetyl-D-glucosamine 2-epimerase
VDSVRLGVVTSTRADYGLLRPVLSELRADDAFELQLIATGTHLSPEFGTTVEEIEADGFGVADRVEMLLSSDSPVGVTTSLGLATMGLAVSYDRLRPELLMVLGDRYEILAAAQAALVARIPVAHLCGGDITEGAIDDAIRHAITKLSHLHFVTNPDAARRVRQMGEDPDHVVVAGNPSLDELARLEPLSREDLASSLGLELRERNLLVTYHPVTLADEPPAAAFGELLAALDALGPDIGIVLTLPNADTRGRVLIDMTRDYARTRAHVVAHDSLGQLRYGSCLKTFDAVVGNSSSGLMEAPAVGTPAVNIGERQRGRLRAGSTIDCAVDRHTIEAAIRRALTWQDVPVDSPDGDGRAAARIMATLRMIDDPRTLLDKRFHRP